MRRLNAHFPIVLFIVMLTFTGCSDRLLTQHSNPPPNDQELAAETSQSGQDPEVKQAENRYIVIFKDQPTRVADAQAAQLAVEQTGNVLAAARVPQDSLIHRYKWASRGFAGRFTEQQVQRLRKHPLVEHVVRDVYYKAIQYREAPTTKTRSSGMMASETTPWGINRVNGPLSGGGNTAWIIDTGIDVDHPDLNVDQSRTVSFLSYEGTNDLNGHGTHVAGTIAAIDNNRDVIGVAAGAQVVGVKVCDGGGFCYASNVKAGVDYVASSFSPGDVANISLGYEVGSDNPRIDIPLSDLDNAITTAANSGLKFTLSAGNSSDNANNYSPTRVEHSNVWTVSAYDINDQFASFSNYGNPPIEYGAPGVNVLSLWKDGGTNTIGGTSMSAPHVAGLLLAASTIDTDGTVSGDPDGNADPIVVSAVLDVSISGPYSLALGEHGTWTASATGGNGSYSYKWYYRSADTNNQWNGPVSYTSSYSTQMYSFDDYLDLRVDVVAANGVEGSSIKHVACSDCEPGGGGGGQLSVDPNN